MARNPAQEKARQQLLDYLLSNNMVGFQFPSMDTTYLTDVGKLYEELALNKGMYDSVTPKYRMFGDDPRALMMGQYFMDIASGFDPDQIIKEHDDKNALNPELKLNDTEKADLKKFATEQAKRDETMWEREQAAAYYGLPSPTQQFTIPTELVAGLRAQKTGLTNAQAIGKELSAMQQEYDKMMAAAPKQTTQTVSSTDFGFWDNPAAWTANKVIDVADKVNPILAGIPGVNGIVGLDDAMGNRSWQDKKIAIPVERPVSKSPTAAKPTSPRVGALGKQINQLERLALAEMDYENRLTQAVAERISSQFGSTYEAATKEAQRIVASRKKGASGNWLK